MSQIRTPEKIHYKGGAWIGRSSVGSTLNVLKPQAPSARKKPRSVGA